MQNHGMKDRGEIAAWEDPEVLGCIDIYRCAALRGKIRPDEAEAEDCGGSTFEPTMKYGRI